jgi:hypothetical protein
MRDGSETVRSDRRRRMPSMPDANLAEQGTVHCTDKRVRFLQVIIPGADGMFGVLPGHVPTISELKPGVVEVTTAPGEVEKYFISSGFCFAHADSTLDVCGIEVRRTGPSKTSGASPVPLLFPPRAPPRLSGHPLCQQSLSQPTCEVCSEY